MKSDSPLIDFGESLPQVAYDFDGASRPHGSGWDIGAYEYEGIITSPNPFLSFDPADVNHVKTGQYSLEYFLIL